MRFLKNNRQFVYLLGIFMGGLTQPLLARSIYMNGVDISSARNQNLANVNLRIDEQGNVYIEAPHYQVNEENSFTPLSSWMENQTSTLPMHKPRQELPNKVEKTDGEEKGLLPKTAKLPPPGAMPEEPADMPKAEKSSDPTPDVEKNSEGLQNKAGSKLGG